MSVDNIVTLLNDLNWTLTCEVGANDIRNQISRVRVSIQNHENRDQIITDIQKILSGVENQTALIREPVKRELGKVLKLLQPTEQLIEGSVQPAEQGKPETLVALLEQMKRLIETTHQ